MTSPSRNHTIARLAYAIALSDGQVSPAEYDALDRFLLVHPERFTAEDRYDILAFWDDFQFSQAHHQRPTTVWGAWRLPTLAGQLLVDDAPAVIDLLITIAEADQRVTPDENEFVAQVREALSGPHRTAA